MMDKVGRQYFYLRKSENGLKFIPKAHGEKLFDLTGGGIPDLVE